MYKIVYAPRGVVGGIAPWNFPISSKPAIATRLNISFQPHCVRARVWCVNAAVSGKILPSTITGNTCVIKPSPYTPLATVMLAECAQKAFPAGVVNILTGGDELGQMIVEHPKVAHISFTGVHVVS